MKTPHRPGAETPATVQPAAARCHPPIGSPLRRCAGRSRTQLLVGLSLLAAAGTAWIPTPPLQMRLPASPSAAPDLPAAQNPAPSSDLPRLTRA